jgi:hypothetical protein
MNGCRRSAKLQTCGWGLLLTLMILAPAMAAEAAGTGGKKAPAGKGARCQPGATAGDDGKCHADLKDETGKQVAAKVSTTNPNYQVLCFSNQRLGDCAFWFNVSANTTGTVGGQRYLWSLYSKYNGPCPTGGSTQPPANPLYNIICVSNQQLGDCGQWFNVVGTTTASSGSQSYIWILFSKYNGACP